MRPKTNQFNKWIQPPGPGNYDPNDGYNSTKHKIGTNPRPEPFNNTDKKFPGPGLYDPMDIQTMKVGNKFGREMRKDFADRSNERCGPGQYYWNKNSKDTKYSFGKDARKTMENPYGYPGPGRYQTQDTKVKNPSFSVGKQGRV